MWKQTGGGFDVAWFVSPSFISAKATINTYSAVEPTAVCAMLIASVEEYGRQGPLRALALEAESHDTRPLGSVTRIAGESAGSSGSSQSPIQVAQPIAGPAYSCNRTGRRHGLAIFIRTKKCRMDSIEEYARDDSWA